MRAKRPRSDSIAAALNAAKAASKGPLVPPSYIALRPGDQPFWDAIISARARDTWNESDLAIAANLARSRADIERISFELEMEGDVLQNTRGTMVANPKHQILEVLSRRTVNLARMLHVHASATLGDPRDNAKAGAAERAAEAAADDLDDDLIPRLRAA
jgi:hypothetical protein